MSNQSIYVGNLSYDATEDDLRDLFSQHGEVSNVNIVDNKFSGKSRGFAFVDMATKEEAEKAIDALHETDFMGRMLIANFARPKEDRPPRSGGDHRGGDRGGRGGDRGGDRRSYR